MQPVPLLLGATPPPPATVEGANASVDGAFGLLLVTLAAPVEDTGNDRSAAPDPASFAFVPVPWASVLPVDPMPVLAPGMGLPPGTDDAPGGWVALMAAPALTLPEAGEGTTELPDASSLDGHAQKVPPVPGDPGPVPAPTPRHSGDGPALADPASAQLDPPDVPPLGTVPMQEAARPEAEGPPLPQDGHQPPENKDPFDLYRPNPLSGKHNPSATAVPAAVGEGGAAGPVSSPHGIVATVDALPLPGTPDPAPALAGPVLPHRISLWEAAFPRLTPIAREGATRDPAPVLAVETEPGSARDRPPEPVVQPTLPLSAKLPLPQMAESMVTEAEQVAELPEPLLLAAVSQPSGPNVPQTPVAPAQPFAPLQQLVAALASPKPGVTELSLAPEELGRVRLQFHSDAQDPDRMVVLLSFDRPETMELFRRHADQLAEVIRAAGYSGVDIGFSSQGQGDGQQDRSSRFATDVEAVAADSPTPAPLFHRPVTGLDLRL